MSESHEAGRPGKKHESQNKWAERYSPDMGNIIELSSDIMQQLGSSKSMSSLDLRTEVSKDNNSRHFRSDQNGSN